MKGVMKGTWLVVAVAAFMLAFTGASQAAGDAEAGKMKAKSCAGCHGKSGEGKGNNPALAGMDEAAFVAAINEYKSGARDHKMMARFAKKLDDDAIADLAAYYASLK
jgi:cytochrome c553